MSRLLLTSFFKAWLSSFLKDTFIYTHSLIFIMENIKRLHCKNCDNIWDYKGEKEFYASCSICHYKVNIKKRQVGNLIL
jgi:hypothetical protein